MWKKTSYWSQNIETRMLLLVTNVGHVKSILTSANKSCGTVHMFQFYRETMTHNVEELRSGIELLTKGAEVLKEKFAAYVADKTVPLEDRWSLFETAPDALKEHSSWYADFKINNEEISWYDDYYLDRHQTMDTLDLVSQTEEMTLSDYTTPKYSENVINDLKEQVLAKNLGSFVYDW